MGTNNSTFSTIIKVYKTINDSYVVKFFKRIISVISTIILVFLLVVGAMMFYFNLQAKAATNNGQIYSPPFGLYTIISPSMEPNIKVYDVVMSVDASPSEIKVGDVITFISTWDINYGMTVTHRVVSVSKTNAGVYQFTTKGDNNQSPDGAVVTSENLIGKVVIRIPQLGKLQFFLATKTGWFLVVFIPAMIVIILDVIKIFKLKVLKDNIEDIHTTSEADKIVFESDSLDNRDLSNTALLKTVVLDKEKIEKVEKSTSAKKTTKKKAPIKLNNQKNKK